MRKQYLREMAVAAGVLLLAACCGPGSMNRDEPSAPSGESSLSTGNIRDELGKFQPQMQVYQCASAVSLVNRLRHLGKRQALEALDQFYAEDTHGNTGVHQVREMTVICLCRML